MKVDLRTLKLNPGKSEHYEFSVTGRDELLADQRACFVDPVKVSLVVAYQGRYFNGQGKLATRVQLTCSRCLDGLIWPINNDFDFIVTPDADDDYSSGDKDILYYGSGLVDIGPLIEELIITEIPFTPICSEDCPGLCPVCGINKNTQKCSCHADDFDPRWEKLRNI